MFILDTILYWVVYGIIGYCLLIRWSCILISAVDVWIKNITKGDYKDLFWKKLQFINKPFEILDHKNEIFARVMFTMGCIFSSVITIGSLLRPDKFITLYEIMAISSTWAVEDLNFYLYGVIVLIGLHFVLKHGYSFVKRVNTTLEKEER